jgi:hypothetical protein
LLLLNLRGITADLEEGAMVVFDEARFRVRRLPI